MADETGSASVVIAAPIGEVFAAGTSRLGTEVARQLIGRDPEDPRAEAIAVFGAEPPERAPRLLEGRGDHLVGDIGRPAPALGEGVDVGGVTAEELGKGMLIVLQGAGHEHPVVG